MNKINRYIFLIGVLVLVVFLTGCDNSSQQKSSTSGMTAVKKKGLINNVAPDFTLTDMQGQQVSLSQYRGKVVILNFWATWCPPCREEMPSMEALHQKYKNKGLVMLAVNVDENGASAVKKFLQKTPYSFPILIDTKNVAQQSYGVFRFPESFIIDRNGVVVEKIIGGRDWMSDGAFKLIEFLLNG